MRIFLILGCFRVAVFANDEATLSKRPYQTNKIPVMTTSKIEKVSNGPYSPDWSSLDSRPLPKWYDEAKFGIFINWVKNLFFCNLLLIYLLYFYSLDLLF